MKDFDKYIKSLADHDDGKIRPLLNPRELILVNAGIRLNWIGDFLANPKIKYKKTDIPVNQVLFTGTSPDWNNILIDQCERSVEKFLELINNDEKMKEKFTHEASFGNEPILMRGPDENKHYRVVDGMHRFVGTVLKNKKTISVFLPTNESENLPICEAHVVYDLIRGYQRHANDDAGKTELYYALKLLARTYENVIELLENRFNATYVREKDVQEIIKKVIKDTKK